MVERSLSMREVLGSMPRYSILHYIPSLSLGACGSQPHAQCTCTVGAVVRLGACFTYGAAAARACIATSTLV